MSRSLLLAAALFPARLAAQVPSTAAVIPFDAKDYPRTTFAKMLAAHPCRARGGLKDLLFSAELVYQGAVRKAPARRRALMREWTRSIGDPDAAQRYAEEATLAEGGKVRWVSVPEGTLAVMQLNLQPGDRTLAYLVFVGCAGREPLFAVDEFEELGQDDEEAEDFLI